MNSTEVLVDRPCDCGCLESKHKGGACVNHPASCPRWRVPRHLRQERTDFELTEMVDRKGLPTRYTVDDAFLFLDMCDHLEREFGQHSPWDESYPGIFILNAMLSPLGTVDGVIFSALEVPDFAWHAVHDSGSEMMMALASNPVAFLGALAASAGAAEVFTLPLVGVALVCEAWVRKPGYDPTKSTNDCAEAREDEVRQVVALDVDARQYTVLNSRITGERRQGVNTVTGLLRHIGESDGPDMARLRRQPGSLPRATLAMRALVKALDLAHAALSTKGA